MYDYAGQEIPKIINFGDRIVLNFDVEIPSVIHFESIKEKRDGMSEGSGL